MPKSIIETDLFEKVWDVIHDAHLIAWDGCHKIYIATDAVQAEWFVNAPYSHIETGTAEGMMDILGMWWEDSCGLRFINAVSGGMDNPKFVTLIEQFADEEVHDEEVHDEEDDDEDDCW